MSAFILAHFIDAIFRSLRLWIFVLQHMRSPSVSCLDVDTSPPTNESNPVTLTPSTPTKSHRRSASCGNNLPSNVQGSGPDMRIIRIRMDLQDGNLYRSILVQTAKPFNSNFMSAVSRQKKPHPWIICGTLHLKLSLLSAQTLIMTVIRADPPEPLYH